MSTYRTLNQASLEGKKVLLRAGFDVPMENGVVTDTSRIESVVPTMRYILSHGASLIIMAHQDRPKGKVIPEMSQKPLVSILEKLLGVTVGFASSSTGEETKAMVDALTPGQVLLLENLRFDAREEKNDPAFAQELAAYADVYVNDAFANCHRAHASMVAIATLLPAYMGLELEQEIEHLSSVLDRPLHPLTFIVSGAKMETKVPVIDHFLEKADNILVGGAIANTFIAAQGHAIGHSLAEPSFFPVAQNMLSKSGKQDMAVIHTPVDATTARTPSDTSSVSLLTAIEPESSIYDLGPATAQSYAESIRASRMIVWNGPLGMYEYEPYAAASKTIAAALRDAASNGATVIVGGGDTIDFHTLYALDMSAYTFVSTGGGAMLDYLSGAALPALEPLKV